MYFYKAPGGQSFVSRGTWLIGVRQTPDGPAPPSFLFPLPRQEAVGLSERATRWALAVAREIHHLGPYEISLALDKSAKSLV